MIGKKLKICSNENNNFNIPGINEVKIEISFGKIK